MILISNDFSHNIKMYNSDPYNVLLAIAYDFRVTHINIYIYIYIYVYELVFLHLSHKIHI